MSVGGSSSALASVGLTLNAERSSDGEGAVLTFGTAIWKVNSDIGWAVLFDERTTIVMLVSSPAGLETANTTFTAVLVTITSFTGGRLTCSGSDDANVHSSSVLVALFC